MLLAIYLNDHLTGATAVRDLVRRAAAANRSSQYGQVLSSLAEEIAEDRETLLSMMAVLDVRVDRLKVAAGWSVEKLGRLKLNGRLRGYSPYSRVLEIETATLGVTGKNALWRTLAGLELPALAEFDLAGLSARAEDQARRLESERLRAAAEAFG